MAAFLRSARRSAVISGDMLCDIEIGMCGRCGGAGTYLTSETERAVHVEEDELLQRAISECGGDHGSGSASEECVVRTEDGKQGGCRDEEGKGRGYMCARRHSCRSRSRRSIADTCTHFAEQT